MAVINPTAQMNPMSAMMGPDVTRQQYELAQNQRYADILMQQALQDQPQGQMVSGHYVPPSPVQGLGQLLKAYIARKSTDLIPERQSKLDMAQDEQLRRMVGMGGGTTAPQARDMALAGGAMQGDVGPTNTNAVRMQNVQTGQGSAVPLISENPMLTYTTLRYGGPQAYAKALVDQQMPTGELKTLIAAGFRPGTPEFQRAASQLANKNAYIAPTVVSEGGSLVPAGANRPTFIAPKGGIQINPQTLQSSVLPGYTQSVGAINQAQAYGTGLGQAQTATDTRYDPATGRTVVTSRAANLGLPTQGMGGAQANTQPVVTAENPVVVKAGEELNKQWITSELEPARLAGDAAKNAMNNIRVLKSIDLTTGFGTDAQKTAASILATLGVKDAAKFATNAQVFESKIYESLVDTLGGQKGVQTKSDFENIQKTYAQLKNTPQANQFLLDVAEAKAMQDQRKSGYYQKAASMPELRNNLSAITNEWGKISGSMFEIPLTDRAGNTYTLAQKYGIR
jgi:hypothetical protein